MFAAMARRELDPAAIRQHHLRSAGIGIGIGTIAAAGIAAKRLGLVPPGLIRETGTVYNKFDPRGRFLHFSSVRPFSDVEKKIMSIPYIGTKFRKAVTQGSHDVDNWTGDSDFAYTIPRTVQIYRANLEKFRSKAANWVTNHLDPLNILGKEGAIPGKHPGIPRVILALERGAQKSEDLGKKLITKLKNRFLDPTVTPRELKKALKVYREANKANLEFDRQKFIARNREDMSDVLRNKVAMLEGIRVARNKHRTTKALERVSRSLTQAVGKTNARITKARKELHLANQLRSKRQLAGVVTSREHRLFNAARKRRRQALKGLRRSVLQQRKTLTAIKDKLDKARLQNNTLGIDEILADQHIDRQVKKIVLLDLSRTHTSPMERFAGTFVDPVAYRVDRANRWLNKQAIRLGNYLELPGMGKLKKARKIKHNPMRKS